MKTTNYCKKKLRTKKKMEQHFALMDRRLDIVKKLITPKLIYKVNAIPMKTSPAFIFFTEIEKFMLKFILDMQETQKGQNNLKKKGEASHLPVLKLSTILQ